MCNFRYRIPPLKLFSSSVPAVQVALVTRFNLASHSRGFGQTNPYTRSLLDAYTNYWGDYWAQPVEILVSGSPTGYMLTSSGFSLLNWGIFYQFL